MQCANQFVQIYSAMQDKFVPSLLHVITLPRMHARSAVMVTACPHYTLYSKLERNYPNLLLSLTSSSLGSSPPMFSSELSLAIGPPLLFTTAEPVIAESLKARVTQLYARTLRRNSEQPRDEQR
jgi:hypothetical protein